MESKYDMALHRDTADVSFNPCYVGSKMESAIQISIYIRTSSFNPCYVGSKMESHCQSEDEESLR